MEVSPEQKVSISFTKAYTKHCFSLHYNADDSYLLVNGKEIIEFKADYKNVTFSTRFCLEIMSDGFSAIESRGIFNWKCV